MKWKIWPRQYGKTHQLREWWLEDPANRVILCGNRNLALNSQRHLEPELERLFPGNTVRENRRLLRTRIISYQTWLNGARYERELMKDLIAVDDLETILPRLLKGNIAFGAGCGSNDIPDPQQANDVAEFHRRTQEKFGVDWDA